MTLRISKLENLAKAGSDPRFVKQGPEHTADVSKPAAKPADTPKP